MKLKVITTLKVLKTDTEKATFTTKITMKIFT